VSETPQEPEHITGRRVAGALWKLTKKAGQKAGKALVDYAEKQEKAQKTKPKKETEFNRI
jgi:hypothetical protein